MIDPPELLVFVDVDEELEDANKKKRITLC